MNDAQYQALFTKIGVLIRQQNLWIAYQKTNGAESLLGTGFGADKILTAYGSAGRYLVPTVQQQFTSFAANVQAWAKYLTGVSLTTFRDIQSALSCPSNNIQTILQYMIEDMPLVPETVAKNTVSVGSVTAGAANVGNGKLVLSGNTVTGIPNETILNETIFLKCVQDQSGGTAGAESFVISGYPTSAPENYLPQGSGSQTVTVSSESGNNLLVNGDFEKFTVTNTPDSWTVVAGTVGTNIFKDTTNLNGAHSTAALRLTSDATATTITLKQVLPVVNMLPNTMYCIGGYLLKSSASGGTFIIRVTGTGLTAANLFSANPSTLTSSYVLHTLFFVTPTIIPPDYRVEITWTSANASSAGTYVSLDDFSLSQTFVQGGVNGCLFRGSVDFVKNDTLTYATTNDNAGVIQTWMGRFYGVQLPSTGGTPTILDSLAE